MTVNVKEKDIAEVKLPYKLIQFMKYRFIGYAFSLLITAFCIFTIATKGFNWGLDFTGGTVIETTFSQPADLEKVRVSFSPEMIHIFDQESGKRINEKSVLSKMCEGGAF